MYLRYNAFIYLKNQTLFFFWQSQVSPFICTYTWEKTMAMIIMMENLATKIVTSKMMMNNMRYLGGEKQIVV